MLVSILIGIIIISIIIIWILSNKLHNKSRDYNILNRNYNSWKEELTFSKNELKRCLEQIKIYEEKEEKITTIKINNQKIKINPIYKGKRALVGDYHDGSSKNTSKILKSFGLTVDIVRTGEDIVDKIKHGYKCDIIFTNNIYQNGYDGPTTLEKLREIDGFNIPVVIHTISKGKKYYFINSCGFDDYIVKPLNQEKIKPILDKFLGSR